MYTYCNQLETMHEERDFFKNKLENCLWLVEYAKMIAMEKRLKVFEGKDE